MGLPGQTKADKSQQSGRKKHHENIHADPQPPEASFTAFLNQSLFRKHLFAKFCVVHGESGGLTLFVCRQAAIVSPKSSAEIKGILGIPWHLEGRTRG